MDFKKLISHIESIDGPIETPKAPQAAEPIRLDEGTELRVLAGVTTLTESVIAEKAVSKAQQQAAGAALAAKRGEGKAVGASKEMAKMSATELKKIAGTKHKGLPEKKTDEGVDVFKNKFSKMVEAKKAKPDFADLDNDGDTKEPMKKAAKDAKVKEGIEDKLADAREKAKAKGKTVKNKEEKPKSNVRKVAGKAYGGSKQKTEVDEAVRLLGNPSISSGRMRYPKGHSPEGQAHRDKVAKMAKGIRSQGREISRGGTQVDPTDRHAAAPSVRKYKSQEVSRVNELSKGTLSSYADKAREQGSAARGVAYHGSTRGAGEKQMGSVVKKPRPGSEAEKFDKFADKRLAGAAKAEKKVKMKEGVHVSGTHKKVFSESVEQHLSFKDMMKLVIESGGQQQIDPVDTALFNWATRVARKKIGEGMKAEVYAGMVYERMGGVFQLYDVLSESYVSTNRQLNEEVDPEEIADLLEKFRNGEIDYEEFRNELDSIEHTEYSMRQGELGMQGDDTPAGHRAWGRENDDWDQLDDIEDDEEDEEDYKI